MKIAMEDVSELLGEFRHKLKENKQWVAFEPERREFAAGDFYYFHAKQDDAFADNTLLQVPLTSMIRQIESEVVIQRRNEMNYLDFVPEPVVQEAMLRNRYPEMREQLEEEMQSFDWNQVYYDPLEANTEAESPEDIQEFNRLEQLLHDLQVLHHSGPDGKELVDMLADKYWKGKPMEDQQGELFAGYTQNGSLLVAKENDHPVSAEVSDKIQLALIKGEHWMVYYDSGYLLTKDDVDFFEERYEAEEFAYENTTDVDHYKTIFFNGEEDVLRQIGYGRDMRIDPDANPLYNKEGNAFTDALIGHFENKSDNKNENVMDMKNLEYLQKNVKYQGFGEKLWDKLEEKLKEGKDKFSLAFEATVNNKPFNATLHFSRPENSEKYFFNNYRAELELSNGEKRSQTFYLFKGSGVTSREAYNLLDGRSVFREMHTKEGKATHPWIQLDLEKPKDKNDNYILNQYHEPYGFDLRTELAKYAIKELDGGEAEKKLMDSLHKGNLQSMTIEKDGASHKMFIEANPQYHSVHLYSEGMRRVNKEEIGKYMVEGVGQGAEQKMAQAPGVAQKPEQSEKAGVAKENKPGQKNGKGKDLLPKKKTAKKKGVTL